MLGVQQQQAAGPPAGSALDPSLAVEHALQAGLAVAAAARGMGAAARQAQGLREEGMGAPEQQPALMDDDAAIGLASFDLPEATARLLAATKHCLSLSLTQRVLRWVRQRQTTVHRALLARLRAEVEEAGPADSCSSRSGRRLGRRVGAAGPRPPSRLGQLAAGAAGASTSAGGVSAASGAAAAADAAATGTDAAGADAAGAAAAAAAPAAAVPEPKKEMHKACPAGRRHPQLPEGGGRRARSLTELHKLRAYNGSWEEFEALALKLRRKRGEI